MNFFKRKFSLADVEGEADSVLEEYPPSPSTTQFSFSSLANRLSSTISAPTSPARGGESLASALERSLAPSSVVHPSAYAADAPTLLVIDDHFIDWSKYFRPTIPGALASIRVEQANYGEIDLMCTENACLVEVNQSGRDARHFSPNAFYIACNASRALCSASILRSLLAAHVPCLNSSAAITSFLSPSNFKKNVRKLKLKDGSKIPILPSIHYPNFHKFNPTNHFPIVVSVGDTCNGAGKIRVVGSDELADLEGILNKSYGHVEVEVEPYIDLKYDLHVQKIGGHYKSFARRGISACWKSNASSAVLEEVKTSQRHVEYLEAISEWLGGCQLLCMHILVSRDNREFVHAFSPTLRYFGEAQEDDRRSVAVLLNDLLLSSSASTPSAAITPPPLPHPPPLPPRSLHPHRSPAPSRPENDSTKEPSFADDTMGQLKRTFAGIFGDM